MRFLDRMLLLGAAPFVAAVMIIACEGDGPLEVIVTPGTLDDGGPLPDVTMSDVPTDGGGDATDAADASPSPVIIAIDPTPKGDGEPKVGDVIDARLKALASGVRGVVLRRGLQALDVPAMGALAQEASFYAQSGMTLAFTLALVDGVADTRPANLAQLPWDAPEVRDEVHHAIEGAMGALGSHLRYLVLGRDVDEYLVAHPERRAAFTALAEDAVKYARSYPEAAPDLRVGVGFSFTGASLPDPSFEDLLLASDMAVLSYLPGLRKGEALSPGVVTADVASMVTLALGKPILLESIGYPTASTVGGAEEKQQLFFKTFFFDALAPRRAGFAFVNVDALTDLGPSRCAARAALQGEPANGPYAAYVCSLGLATAEGTDKTAWPVFLQAAAAFASP